MSEVSEPKSRLGALTVYFLYLLAVATVGPLLFGYHLVNISISLPREYPTLLTLPG